MVGKLIYLSHTRPDIGFLVSVASQLMNNPTKEHMKRLLHILRYLKKTPEKVPTSKRQEKEILKSLLMQIGLDPPQIKDPHQGIVLMCGEIWLPDEVKNKQLVLGVVQKQSSELWPMRYVNECG